MASKDIKKLQEFLSEAGTYFLATVDEDQPRVRPFGTALLFEDKIYMLTAKGKDVSKQLAKNPKFEITAMDKNGRWVRVSGVLVEDNRVEVHEALLEAYPNLKAMYKAGDANTHALYLSDVKATIYSFTGEPEVLDI